MIVISNKFDFGDLVYLTSDEAQSGRLIVGIRVMPDGGIVYSLRSGILTTEHYEFEVSEEKNVIASTTN